MKLVASLVVRNELGRYLKPCIDHLEAFCDQVVVLDDGSDDGSLEWLRERLGNEQVCKSLVSTFYDHEGRTRNALLDFTLGMKPTHILAIDADEFVSDGAALRASIEQNPNAIGFAMTMTEIWEATPAGLRPRVDGGWRPCRTTCLYRAPSSREARLGGWRIRDLALACGREPDAVRRSRNFAETGVQLLHFGWANQSMRVARHARYAEHDGGNFHASAHLDSILWEDRRVRLSHQSWPEALDPWKDEILRGAGYLPV